MTEKIEKMPVSCDILALFQKKFLEKMDYSCFSLVFIPILINIIFLLSQRTDLFHQKICAVTSSM